MFLLKRKWQSVCVLSILIFNQVELQPSATVFTRACNEPLVIDHLNKFKHTYCFHACGFLLNQLPDSSSCDASGDCVCAYPKCSDSTFQKISSDICPPYSSDPPDPDPYAQLACSVKCALKCSGGEGIICGEIEPLGPTDNLFAKVCTCHCPPERCTPTTTTPPAYSLLNVVKNSVGLIGPVFLKPKIRIKLIIKKLLKLCKLMLVVCIFYLLKCALIFLYYLALQYWIGWEYSVASNMIQSSLASISSLMFRN